MVLRVYHKNKTITEIRIPAPTPQAAERAAKEMFTRDAGLFQVMVNGVCNVRIEDDDGNQVGYVGPDADDDPGNFD